MAKLNLKDNQVNEVLGKLTPAWQGCVSVDTLAKAQVPKSSSRNWLFGTLMNKKFIKLSRACNGFKKGEVVSLVDIYDSDSASNLASLMIYRLGHSGLSKTPQIVEA